MIAITAKQKNHLFTATKFLVVAISFGFIIHKVRSTEVLNLEEFIRTIFSRGIVSGYLIVVFLLFAAANWCFEILKWQTLVSSFEKIDFKTAMKQSLASLTVSLATPNRIGEYGAKALYFEAQDRKKVLLLNFYSGAIQMLVTTVFGIIGLFYLIQKFNLSLSYEGILIVGLIIGFLFGIGYILKEKELLFKGFSIGKIVRFFKNTAFSIKLKASLYSIIRYIIFSSLFLGLLIFFDANISISEAYLLIFVMYFLVSVLPTLFIFDVVIRGGVAVWLFSYVGVPELTVLSTVFAMWLLNFVIPSILGSFYVITYQPTIR
ncbi:lysylphosphatidylglycerol synthase domain-containing protein [Aequorivita capsosiphonis]|uniref:lysylphosphatidylglycerol synthase domain-containing protein n=1 Tax=Aequorivita capsosiphonis TaxID=487317 RepID=UPI000416B2B5|nr:lysylphosphatidylglycerol synthase domain-containing protein [Aequorivita capsosiphonis]